MLFLQCAIECYSIALYRISIRFLGYYINVSGFNNPADYFSVYEHWYIDCTFNLSIHHLAHIHISNLIRNLEAILYSFSSFIRNTMKLTQLPFNHSFRPARWPTQWAESRRNGNRAAIAYGSLNPGSIMRTIKKKQKPFNCRHPSLDIRIQMLAKIARKRLEIRPMSSAGFQYLISASAFFYSYFFRFEIFI